MNGENSLPVRIPVKDLKPGDAVLQFFELRRKDVRKTRNGEDYLDLTAGDATGDISAKMWPDAVRRWGTEFSPGDFVKIEGMVEKFRERNQLVIEKMRVAERAEVPGIDELVKTSPYDSDALLDELKIKAQGLKPQELAELVTEILENNGETLKTYPAARMVHHAYTGGLIEHVATVTRKVEAICSMVPAVNRDVAVAGAMLHDIGKLRELDPPKRGRTLEGRLVGHLVLGVEMILEAALHKNVIDRTWVKELEHIVVSHHGETDFGSPIPPLTREATVVHYIDNLDAKLKIIEEALQSPEPDGFSSYNRWLEGRAFAGSHSLEKEEDDAGT